MLTNYLEQIRGMTARISLLTTDLLIKNVEYVRNGDVEFPHSHLYHELYFVLDGQISVAVDTSDIPLWGGDLLYVGPQNVHHCHFVPGASYRYLVLSFDLVGGAPRIPGQEVLHEAMRDEQDLINNLFALPYQHSHDRGGCRQEVEQLCLSLSKRYMGELAKIHCYLLNFFVSAMQSFSGMRIRPDFEQIVEEIGIHNRATRIADYLWKHCMEPLTIHSVSQALYYSPRHIQRIISDDLHIGFSELLTYCRIGQAKQMLATTDASLEYISDQCGFGSSQSLCKHFKKLEGLSPSQYRKQTYIQAG